MSNINIRRAVENIRAKTTVYTPVIEVIVNAIQAIDESGRDDGRVSVRALRSSQARLDGSLREIIGFEIVDNGIGFTNEHRDSFDTLYTDHRIAQGGKGFGRFTCLKYFHDLRIVSIFRDGPVFRRRSFSMGKRHDIIVDEETAISDQTDTRTVIHLAQLEGKAAFDKKLSTIARNLVERLLPYFVIEDYKCPTIELSESDGSNPLLLNDFVTNELSASIREVHVDQNAFSLTAVDKKEGFRVRVFKLYAPRNQRSRISLVAHRREVSTSALTKYVPEFETEFYDRDETGEVDTARNYVIRAYVFAPYLDHNVSLERGGFEFGMDNELLLGISQAQIEQGAADIARAAVGSDITLRQEKKRERVVNYVDEQAPWHKEILNKVDLSDLPYNATEGQIEARLQKEKFAQEVTIKKDVAELLAAKSIAEVQESATEIVKKISNTSKNDLIHYVALRKKILDVFDKSLQLDEDGGYSSEGVVHDIIFPRRGDTETTYFCDHNLWILDERLNFTSYVSSDRPLSEEKSGRPDLLAYGRRVLFRGDNDRSNPITIFEFKKPQRDDFANPAFPEDPVQQIIRYANAIRNGKYKTPEGRNMRVGENTPFYGFVVCDLTKKVEVWLEQEKDFKAMPDRLGWFKWMDNINLYVEVISWDKVLKDAQVRNRIFFEKLGI